MENKKSNAGLIVLIIILILMVMCLGGYIVYDKFLSDTFKPKETKKEIKKEEKLVSKVNDSKDWVYDAVYEKDVTADSYSTGYYTYYAKDIVVPYININSTFAKRSNDEIKTVFDKAIEAYNEGVNNQMTYIKDCNYTKYEDKDMLSVFFQLGVGATDIVQPDYYTYNIDLKTGKELSYEEVYKKAGFTKENIESKAVESITKFVNDTYFNNELAKQMDTEKYVYSTIDNYKESVLDNSIKYYLSKEGNLNVIVKVMIPAGKGEHTHTIEISK